jgi:hypothetical protein
MDNLYYLLNNLDSRPSESRKQPAPMRMMQS